MRIISRMPLEEFILEHPKARTSLDRWYAIMLAGTFNTFVELRKTFPATDQVGQLTVFNIGGNKVRLIAYIRYNKQQVFVRSVLTHAEYDKGKWKE